MNCSPIHTLRLIAATASLSFAVFQSSAQESSNSYTPKEPRQSSITSNNATGSLNALSPRSRESTPLQLGPVLFRPGISYRYTDATNLLRSIGDSQDSEIQNINLTLGFDYQDLWSLSFNPSWTYYSNDHFEDSDSNSANFSSNFGFQDWNIGIFQSYRDSNRALVETASQTQQESWGTTLSASRQLNSAWYLDLSADQDLLSTDSYSDVREWSTSGWLRHQGSAAVNSSIGLTWGYADIDPGLNIKYKQALLRFGINPTNKLSASLQGGIDFREIDAPGFKQEENPTYNASVQYQAFDYTTIAFNIGRQISASYFSNSNNETESITLSLSQRLFEHFNLTISYGERSSHYLDLLDNAVVVRKDEYDSFSAELGTQLLNRINISAFYRNNQNTTNATGFGFSSDQTGFQIGYQY